jgi:sec-independent protein translocase protein TatB
MGPELFGVGAAEAVLVFVIALILVGPQRFPEIARQAGRWYQIARRYTAEVTKDVRGAMEDLEEEVKAETADLREVRTLGEELETGMQATERDLDAIGKDVEASTGATPASLAPGPASSASRTVSSGTAGPPARSDKMPPKPPLRERPTPPAAATAPDSEPDDPSENGVSARSTSSSDS